ncbi:hypothetical protein FGB62_495g00 [Gracilaria domingensis]|nr:hypothetical protein FGB62_495g00 [Gracilaria domingensis]
MHGREGFSCFDEIHAGDGSRAGKRRDAVMYRIENETHRGIVQSIFVAVDMTESPVCIIRRLSRTEPEPGNEKIVRDFGHHRYCYVAKAADIQLDVISSTDILRLIMIIPDPWWASKTLGVKLRLNAIPDDVAMRRNICFFENVGFCYTTFAESFC